MVLKIQNATPTVFIRSEQNFLRNKAVIREYKDIKNLAICQKITQIVALRSFNMGL